MDTIAPRLLLGWSLSTAPAPGMGAWTATIGPAGFLDLLATWLGVPTRRETTSVRIATLLATLRDNPQLAFWSASFATDPWSTARQVLTLRDRLRMAGWDGTGGPGTPIRIADLARLSAAIPAGEPDLLDVVLTTLQTQGCNEIAEVLLAEPAPLWPWRWQTLFRALAAQGIEVNDLPLPTATAGHDLQALRSEMQHGTTAVWQGDGSLCLLASETEVDAADLLSAWFATAPDDLVVVKRSGGLLDPFLRSRHLPRLGGGRGSASGLLPLALALRWDPFDAAAALEFLSLHRTPLGPAARFLSDAIQESPGHGGPRFRDGVRRAAGNLLCRLHTKGIKRVARKQQARTLLDEIAYWLPAQRYTYAEELPTAEIVAVCEKVIAWAQRRQDPDAAAPAAALVAVLAALRQDRIARPLLGRILDAVATAGKTNPGEAAPWRHAVVPGALVSPAETVLWWLTEPAAASPPPWRAAELIWMAAHGLHPDDASMRRGRERAALARAVAQPRTRLILVRPRAVSGDPAPVHPLLADLHACFGDSLDSAWTDAGSLSQGGTLAGQNLATAALPRAAPPAPLRDWTVPAETINPRIKESPSGMEKMLGCQLAWLLNYGAGLRARGPARLPGLDQMTGSFLHNVLGRLYDNPAGSLDHAFERARDVFEKLLPHEAAPLMMPGMEAGLARAYSRFVRAVGTLAQIAKAAGVAAEATERTLRRPLSGGGVLEGRLDLLLLRQADGLRLVLDAKWSSSANRHREALAANKSVQLAAYAWLAEPLGPRPVTAGYFMVRQGRIHTSGDEPFPGTAEPGTDLPGAWQRALHSYTAGLAAMQAGHVVAAGVPDVAGANINADTDLLVLDPPCRWCEYRPLCGATEKKR